MSFKHEIGDQFENGFDDILEIEARRTSADGTNWYWCVDQNGEPCTYAESGLEYWEKVEPFFRVGDTFASPWDSCATMTVTHIDDLVKSAWVTVTSEEDSPRKESIGAMTWRRVKDEILKNRSN